MLSGILPTAAEERGCLAEILERPERAALAIGNEHGSGLRYGDLRALIARTRSFLDGAGIGPADTVAFALRNGPHTAALFLALASHCRVAPINPTLTAAEIGFALRDLDVTAVITTPDPPAAATAAVDSGAGLIWLNPASPAEFVLEPAIPLRSGARAALSTGADDVALLLHTSGTTARPKLAGLTHRQLILSSRAVAGVLRLTPADRCLSMMPFFHIHGLVAGLLASIQAGASVWCPSGFQATGFWSWLTSTRATWYTAVPAMHQAILTRAARHRDVLAGHSLRLIRSSSSPLFPAVAAELEEVFGVPALNAYGMTEAAHQISSRPLPGDPRSAGVAGVGFSSGPEIAILSEAGDQLPPGVRGEVALRGDQVIGAYLSPASANESAFSHGWFRTGDEGFLGANGELTLTGRLKEMINRGGEKVSPVEIDTVLMHHPAIVQALTFGVPCAARGEKIYAAVVLNADVRERELQSFVRERLARFKVPEKIFILDEIPKGPTGKMQRLAMAGLLGVA